MEQQLALLLPLQDLSQVALHLAQYLLEHYLQVQYLLEHFLPVRCLLGLYPLDHFLLALSLGLSLLEHFLPAQFLLEPFRLEQSLLVRFLLALFLLELFLLEPSRRSLQSLYQAVRHLSLNPCLLGLLPILNQSFLPM